jgi:DNA-binding response OmpR family regulator
VKKILVIDDDAELRANLAEILGAQGYETHLAASGKEGIAQALVENFDVILLDLVMPGIKGTEALTEIRKLKPKTKIIMITAFATVQGAVEAIQKGASDYITKPFKIDEFLATIGMVLEEARFEDRLETIGIDDALHSLSNLIRRNILRQLQTNKRMRLMEITRTLNIDDHTKVVFHLKILRESGMIEQAASKEYTLTKRGESILECLCILERFLG